MLSGKGVVDEKTLLVIVLRVSFCESGKSISEVQGLNAPSVPLKLLYLVIMEVLVVDGIVVAEDRSSVIIDLGLVAMVCIVTAGGK